MSALDFEHEMECLECEHRFYADLDNKPVCPKCKGVKVEFVELDEPDPEA
jgi:Zn finger protein HypA/HybF involved in hydrogenase expression